MKAGYCPEWLLKNFPFLFFNAFIVFIQEEQAESSEANMLGSAFNSLANLVNNPAAKLVVPLMVTTAGGAWQKFISRRQQRAAAFKAAAINQENQRLVELRTAESSLQQQQLENMVLEPTAKLNVDLCSCSDSKANMLPC